MDRFDELVELCVSFYEESKGIASLERVRERRSELSFFVEAFHRDCGTLTSSVRERISELRNGNVLILMTAHQPNFFPYSGVFRKATLNFVLAKKLEEALKLPVVNFFGIADQDFADDRWVRSCQLPAVQRSDGVLTINVKLPEKLVLNRVGKPSSDLLKRWKVEVERWLDDAGASVERLCKVLGFEELCSSFPVSVLSENLESFWSLVEDCCERSMSFSDFSAFLMSRIVNCVWEYDTLFSRFSECQRAFVGEFNFLLAHFEDYSRLLREAGQKQQGESISSGVSEQEPLLVPFWFHCDCGSKAKLFVMEKDVSLFGSGRCEGCGKDYELDFGSKSSPDVSSIASRISARAIPMGLVFFGGLMPSCYVGGAGGATYLMESQHVAKGLHIPFPPIAIWRPHDRYLGVGQMEALLEMRRICGKLKVQELSEARKLLESRLAEAERRLGELEAMKQRAMEKSGENPDDEALKGEIKEISLAQTEIKKSCGLSVLNHELKILGNVSNVSDLMPSIIDYAVNLGLRETSSQWIQYLIESGSLFSDVHLQSVLNHRTGSDVDVSRLRNCLWA